MKQLLQIQSWFLIFAFASFLSSCTSMGAPLPDTANKTISLIELSYGKVLDTMSLYIEEGRLSKTEIKSLDKTFTDVEDGITAATAAVRIGDQLEFDNQVAAINSSLSIARLLLDGVR